MINKLFTKYMHVLLATLLFSFTFCFFAPMEIYLTQSSSFWFSLGNVFQYSLIVTVLTFFVMFGIGIILKKYSHIYSVLIFIIAFALYIQGNFMQIEYGLLDGGGINWSEFHLWGVVNSIVWILILSVILTLNKLKPKLVQNIIMFFSISIVLVQITTLITVIAFSDSDEIVKKSESMLIRDEMLTLSQNENIIIFILDAFDRAIYDEYIQEHPSYKETIFENFTYFEDTLGGARRTKIALPYILTGVPFQTNQTYDEYLNSAYESSVLYDVLIKNNYKSGLYVNTDYAVSDYMRNNLSDHIVNLQNSEIGVSSPLTFIEDIYTLVSFRYFPHFLKQYFEIYTGDFNDSMGSSSFSGTPYTVDDAKFYENLISDKISLDTSDSNLFKVYHLLGPHGPYTLTEDAKRADETSQYEQISGNFKILEEFFSQMKELGIYDSSNIIIMADHGENVNYEANPILLVKESKDGHEYSVSNAPVSYSNLHPTLMSMVDGQLRDNTFFSDLDDQNIRYFYAESGGTVIEYSTDERNDSNYIFPTGKIFNMERPEIENVKYNTEYKLRGTGEGHAYIIEGESNVEPNYMWTDGDKLSMSIPLAEELKGGNVARITFNLISVFNDRQRVGISVNGEELGGYFLTKDRQFYFDVTPEQLNGNLINFTLTFPDAFMPSHETRTLALAIDSFFVTQVDEDNKEHLEIIDMNTPNLNALNKIDKSYQIVLSKEKEMENSAFNLKNWHLQNEDGIWTTENSSLTINMDNSHDIVLSINYIKLSESINTELIVNDVKVVDFPDMKSGKVEIEIPKELLNENGNQLIEISTPEAKSPIELNINNDVRVLGVFVNQISIETKE